MPAPAAPAQRKLAVAVALAVATSAQGLLTYASKVDGKYTYNTQTVPFLAELVKVCYSGGRLLHMRRTSPSAARVTFNWFAPCSGV